MVVCLTFSRARFMRLSSLALALFFTAHLSIFGAETEPAKTRQGAELLKTDILGVFAHPDDETGMAATLAKYAADRVVANIYCTRGEGGGNMVGTQGGAALRSEERRVGKE